MKSRMAARDVHNHRNRQVDQPRGISTDPIFLMATRGEDAEPVLIAVDEGTATFELDDGQTVAFDLTELRTALADHYTIRCDACGRLGLDEVPDCDHTAAWFVTARGWNEWRPVRGDA